LVQRKGHDILLRALQKTDPSIDLRLVIASDGPERNSLERLTAELGLTARVHFLGYFGDISRVYRSSDMVALASRGDAFGLVLAEAGFFGLPVVSTKVGGIPEVIADGVSGILVPPDDPDALAVALTRLAKDAGYRRMLGEAARTRVERMFRTRRMAAEFQETYERLVRIDRRMLGWRSMTGSLAPYGRLAGLTISKWQRPGRTPPKGIQVLP
jgi:glycosyltransferase involved in cell wall biosynthesis